MSTEQTVPLIFNDRAKTYTTGCFLEESGEVKIVFCIPGVNDVGHIKGPPELVRWLLNAALRDCDRIVDAQSKKDTKGS
jgi:hypothetical protein